MKIEVTNLEPEIAVAIKRTAVSMDKLVEVIDEANSKLMKCLAEQGKQLTGAPYCAYLNANEDCSQFDVEWGFPVGEPLSVQGELYMSRTCGGKVITTTHKGAYKDLEAAYTALMEYAKENSLELTDACYDYYLNDPTNTPESELLTKVIFPVK